MVFVGNNWGGTADILAPETLRRLGTIDVVPDYDQRMQEILSDPYRLVYFLAIRTLIGEGHDQLVDDMYSSNDGKLVVISRPSFADVVAISLKTKKIVWRFKVAGVRSDHMAISPNGRQVDRQRLDRPTSYTCCGSRTARRSVASSPAARLTRASSSTAASGSCTPASARSTARSTSPACPTRSRASAASRS